MNGWDIIVLVDGTSSDESINTNIYKLNGISLDCGITPAYRPGFNTFSRSPIWDMLFAPRLDTETYELFREIVKLNLSENDNLYIVGYSRGAVTARTLAHIISSNDALTKFMSGRKCFSPIRAKVRFVGLFDPVVGRPRKRKFVDECVVALNPELASYVEIIASDEVRPHFPSDSFTNSTAVRRAVSHRQDLPKPRSRDERSDFQEAIRIAKVRKLIWMPGKHSDIGGQNGNQFIGGHSLLTLLNELAQASEICGRPLPLSGPKFELAIENERLTCSTSIQELNEMRTNRRRRWASRLIPGAIRKPDQRFTNVVHETWHALVQPNGRIPRKIQDLPVYRVANQFKSKPKS
jgi:hypothetical protein